MNDLEKAKYLASEIQKRGINLCNTFESWTSVAMSLADLGESGRDIFHALASMDDKYKPAESEKKYTYCLHTTRNIHFATFVWMAQQAGVAAPKDAAGYKATYNVQAPKPQPLQIKPLPDICYKPYLQCRTRNNFVNGLLDKFGTYDDGSTYEAGVAAIGNVYNSYHLCSSIHDHEKIVFFQIDKQGIFRAGKVMSYGKDLHRIKTDGKGAVGWTHREQRISFSQTSCLFGEHLLATKPEAVVCVVESEKTAVIGAILKPECVWVAMSGHSYRLMMAALTGRKVVLFPDADQWQKNQAGLERIRQDISRITRSFVISDWAKDEPEGSTKDIADYMMEQYQKPHKDNTLQRVVEKYPCFIPLQLEIV